MKSKAVDLSRAVREGVDLSRLYSMEHPPSLFTHYIRALLRGGRACEAWILTDALRCAYEPTSFTIAPGLSEYCVEGVAFLNQALLGSDLLLQVIWYEGGVLHLRSRLLTDLEFARSLRRLWDARLLNAACGIVERVGVGSPLGSMANIFDPDSTLDAISLHYSAILTHLPVMASISATLERHGGLSAYFESDEYRMHGPEMASSVSGWALACEMRALVEDFMFAARVPQHIEVLQVVPHGLLRQLPQLTVGKFLSTWILPRWGLLPLRGRSKLQYFDRENRITAYVDSICADKGLGEFDYLDGLVDRVRCMAEFPSSVDLAEATLNDDVALFASHGHLRFHPGAGLGYIGLSAAAFQDMHALYSTSDMIRARVMIASACWSAIPNGDLNLWDSWHDSIPGLLIATGVDAVVAAFWLVDDEYAKGFEGRFLETWRYTQSAATAFRVASSVPGRVDCLGPGSFGLFGLAPEVRNMPSPFEVLNQELL